MSKNKKNERREITINGTKHTLPEMSTPEYLDFCDISEEIDGVQYYRRQHFTKMAEGLALAYGNQFTADDVIASLKPADIILEFSMLEVSLLQEVDSKAEEIAENFTSST